MLLHGRPWPVGSAPLSSAYVMAGVQGVERNAMRPRHSAGQAHAGAQSTQTTADSPRVFSSRRETRKERETSAGACLLLPHTGWPAAPRRKKPHARRAHVQPPRLGTRASGKQAPPTTMWVRAGQESSLALGLAVSSSSSAAAEGKLWFSAQEHAFRCLVQPRVRVPKQPASTSQHTQRTAPSFLHRRIHPQNL